MHPTYNQAINAITIDKTVDHTFNVAQIYADTNTNYLKAWRSSYGNKNNLFAYFTDPHARASIENNEFFAFEANMTPTHYRYVMTGTDSGFVFSDKDNAHTISPEIDITAEPHVKIPNKIQLNRQYSALFCDLHTEDLNVSDHIESYYHYLLKETGQIVLSLPKNVLVGEVPTKKFSLYKERYNILTFLASLTDDITMNELKQVLNTKGRYAATHFKIFNDFLQPDFLFLWIYKPLSEKQPPT